MLWHNIIGRLLKPSLRSEIRPPYYSWDFDTNLLRTCGNSVANQRSHIEPGKSDVQASLILAEVIQSGLPTCPNKICSLHTSRGCQNSAIYQNSALVPWSSLSPCLLVAPVSGLIVEILNCNFKAPSQNLIYAKL